MKNSEQQLKLRFLDAVICGELGTVTDRGATVSLKQFKDYFTDIKTQYVSSFLPAAVIETGQFSITHTRFLFRIKKGVYLIHPDAIAQHKQLRGPGFRIEEPFLYYYNYELLLQA